MIIPDINVLVYAHIRGSREHTVARSWWDGLLSGTDPVGIVGPVALGFVRLTTNRRVLSSPLTVDEALDVVTSWLDQPNAQYLADSVAIFHRAGELLRAVGTAGNLTTDAQIAAFAIEHSAVVATNDADFSRFPGVRAVNPLR